MLKLNKNNNYLCIVKINHGNKLLDSTVEINSIKDLKEYAIKLTTVMKCKRTVTVKDLTGYKTILKDYPLSCIELKTKYKLIK